MKTTTWITLLSIGAILAFAITSTPHFLNLQVVGWVLMATGGIGAIIPGDGQGWFGRSRTTQSEDEAATVADGRQRPQFSRVLVPGGFTSPRGAVIQPTGGQVQAETIED